MIEAQGIALTSQDVRLGGTEIPLRGSEFLYPSPPAISWRRLSYGPGPGSGCG